MTIVIADRVKQISITTGSGTIALSGSFGGFQDFDVIGDGNETFYGLENESRYEVGIGTYSGGNLTRDTVLSSSNSGAKVSLDGVTTVFCTYPADHAVYTNASGFLDLTTTSGLILPDISVDDATISGNLLVQPYSNQMTNFIRSTSGNFFQAYVDDANDRTIALYTDATSSPQWRLGLKENPTFVNQPPTYAYMYGEDGDIGMVSDNDCSFSLKHSTGFAVTHKGVNIIEAGKVTGVYIAAPDFGPSLTLAGSGQMTRLGVSQDVIFQDVILARDDSYTLSQRNGLNAQALRINKTYTSTSDYEAMELTSDGSNFIIAAVSGSVGGTNRDLSLNFGNVAVSGTLTFNDGTSQTTAFVDHSPISGIAVYASGQVDLIAADLIVVSGLSSTDYTTQIVANSASGIAISGWAANTFATTDTDTTYTGGSGITLQGGVFHATNTFASDILANTASGTANSGYFQTLVSAIPSPTDYSVDILANTASGTAGDAAVSGWVVAQGYLTSDADTTYTAGSGMGLVGNVFHWTESGIPIANSGYFETKIAGLGDNDTTYTAGSGMELVGTVFHWTESGVPIANSGYFQTVIDAIPAATDYNPQIVANSASGVAISGWAAATFSDINYPSSGVSGAIQTASGSGEFTDSGWKLAANHLHVPTTNARQFVVSHTDVTHTNGLGAIVINPGGPYSHSYATNAIAIGYDTRTTGTRGVTIGNNIGNDGTNRLCIGAYQTALLDADTTDGILRIGDLQLRHGDSALSAASFTVMKTWTADDDYEGLQFSSDGTNHTIESVAGAGGGTVRPLLINADVTTSGTLTAGSGIELQDVVPASTTNKLYNDGGTLLFNGSAVNTTYTAGSGLSLVGTTFHWTESGVSIANSGYFQGQLDALVDNDTTYTAGSGMELVGTVFHWTQSGIPIANSGYAEAVYLKEHPNISAASSSDNSGRTYIQDVTLDSNGHVTGLVTATETVTDTDTTYTAGSGLTLVGTEFNTQGSGNFEGLIVNKAIKTSINTEPDLTTITYNMNDANVHMSTLGGNRTLAVENVAPGQRFMLRLKQDGTGGRTVTWFSDIKWENGAAPTLSSAANHTDWFGFVCTSGGYYDGCVVMSGVR